MEIERSLTGACVSAWLVSSGRRAGLAPTGLLTAVSGDCRTGARRWFVRSRAHEVVVERPTVEFVRHGTNPILSQL